MHKMKYFAWNNPSTDLNCIPSICLLSLMPSPWLFFSGESEDSSARDGNKTGDSLPPPQTKVSLLQQKEAFLVPLSQVQFKIIRLLIPVLISQRQNWWEMFNSNSPIFTDKGFSGGPTLQTTENGCHCLQWLIFKSKCFCSSMSSYI